MTDAPVAPTGVDVTCATAGRFSSPKLRPISAEKVIEREIRLVLKRVPPVKYRLSTAISMGEDYNANLNACTLPKRHCIGRTDIHHKCVGDRAVIIDSLIQFSSTENFYSIALPLHLHIPEMSQRRFHLLPHTEEI